MAGLWGKFFVGWEGTDFLQGAASRPIGGWDAQGECMPFVRVQMYPPSSVAVATATDEGG